MLAISAKLVVIFLYASVNISLLTGPLTSLNFVSLSCYLVLTIFGKRFVTDDDVHMETCLIKKCRHLFKSCSSHC